MTDQELLNAMSAMMDNKLQPVIANMATKTDVKSVFDELISTEKWLSDLDEKHKNLTGKVDTLLLKADNTALLLQLINKQAGELEAVKMRMNELEKKIS